MALPSTNAIKLSATEGNRVTGIEESHGLCDPKRKAIAPAVCCGEVTFTMIELGSP